ncbi:NUDIX domain-containing protein [Niabella hirudinis]|uniref:NUDIX domain-containing protein n=1 Tax=Niabella hirudinis TaxID=1285929 RepID=UPI003EBF78CF
MFFRRPPDADREPVSCGKIEDGEAAVLSLKREIREELNLELHTDDLTYFGYITAPAYGEAPHIQDCFLYTLRETVQPGNEILAIAYFDEETYKKEPAQVPGVLQLFAQLKQNRQHDTGSYD